MSQKRDPRSVWRCSSCDAAIVKHAALAVLGPLRDQRLAGWYASQATLAAPSDSALTATIPGACSACGASSVSVSVSMDDVLLRSYEKRKFHNSDDPSHAALREAIRRDHGCDSRWLESVSVEMRYSGESVQVFELLGHPSATRVYAWQRALGGERTLITVLHAGKAVDARSALLEGLRKHLYERVVRRRRRAGTQD